MKLRLLCVGRLSEAYLRDGCERFQERLRHYLPLVVEEFKEGKSGSRGDLARVVAAEGELLLARIPDGAFVIVLDERGKGLSSMGLAALMEQHMVAGTGEWVLVIGGARAERGGPPAGKSAVLPVGPDLSPPDRPTAAPRAAVPRMHDHPQRTVPPSLANPASTG